MSDMLTFIASIRTNKVGSDCEFEVVVDRVKWEQMSTEERDQHVLDLAFDAGVMDFDYDDPADD